MNAGRHLLDRVVSAEVLDGHDGRSGASIERVRLDDGTQLVVKRARPADDLTMDAAGGDSIERRLWSSGAFDRLPPGIGHPIVELWVEGDLIVTVMRDLGDTIPGWQRKLSRADCRRLFAAVTSMHRTFADDPPGGLCTLEARVTLLSPQSMAPRADGDNPLPALVLRGWERFAELAPPAVVDAVFAIHDDPTALTAGLREAPMTLVHADLWPVNLALTDDEVVLLDWAIATEGPAALELAVFLQAASAVGDADRDDLVEDFRAATGDLTLPRVLDLALVVGLVDLGWNKALDAAEHEDPDTRAREQADLDWWIARSRHALDL